LTRKGRTARLLSARRPAVPIYAVTQSEEVARPLSLLRSVRPIVDALEGDADAVAARIVAGLRSAEAIAQPATIVIVSANPNIEKTGVNFVAVRRL
jgi:pyruvate kinase